ncbi:cation:proton antiporter [Patescibacteria group bacterium]|nr:cation:proton antiporter [Patescibacteria group bacterium]
MEIILLVIGSLVFVNLGAFVLRKMRLPIVLGFILSGMLLSLPVLKDLFPESSMGLFGVLGAIGLGMLMFIAGLEISWYMLLKEKKESLIVALFGLAVPFLLGLIVMLLIGFSLNIALIVAVCMSITAEATTAEVLLDMGKIKTRIGTMIMGAGIIDDVVGMMGFAVFGYFIMHRVDFAEFVPLLIVLGSFLAGMLAHRYIGRKTRAVKFFEKWAGLLIVPFFFVEMGMHFSFSAVFANPLLLLVIVVVAMFGKILGVVLSRTFVRMNKLQSYVVGLAMNSRGAVELALAYTAYKAGLLSIDLYSAIIVMAFVTTFIFPIVFGRIIRKNKDVMV